MRDLPDPVRGSRCARRPDTRNRVEATLPIRSSARSPRPALRHQLEHQPGRDEDEPSLAYFSHRLARTGRVICFDKRGTGVSDPVPLGSLPTLEKLIPQAAAVIDVALARSGMPARRRFDCSDRKGLVARMGGWWSYPRWRELAQGMDALRKQSNDPPSHRRRDRMTRPFRR